MTGLTLISIREIIPHIGVDYLVGIKNNEASSIFAILSDKSLTNLLSVVGHRSFPCHPGSGHKACLAILPYLTRGGVIDQQIVF